jgi:Fe-S-cluster containining protein
MKKEGFAFSFDPAACAACGGGCCRGESGYVWVKKDEIAAIADFLGMQSEEFIEQALKKVGYRYTIKEVVRQGEHMCLFFDPQKGCEIYEVRPRQCREYPFWERYKEKKNIHEVCAQCPGISLL